MTTFIIKFFKYKHHNRVSFVRLLVEFNDRLTLKPAKELLDNMLDGQPISYQVSNSRVKEFQAKLDEHELEYDIEVGE